MKISRLKRLPVLAHFLLIASDAVLWYFGAVLGAVWGPAFLGVAAAWAAGILTIEYPVASAWYQKRQERKAEREAAYAEFLAFADGYAQAWRESARLGAANDAANSDLETAKNRYELDNSYENGCAVTSAETKAAKTAESLLSAKLTADDLLEEYLTAKARVDQLAPKALRQVAKDFNTCLTLETSARDTARSRFIKAVQSDLGQPHWPDRPGDDA